MLISIPSSFQWTKTLKILIHIQLKSIYWGHKICVLRFQNKDHRTRSRQITEADDTSVAQSEINEYRYMFWYKKMKRAGTLFSNEKREEIIFKVPFQCITYAVVQSISGVMVFSKYYLIIFPLSKSLERTTSLKGELIFKVLLKNTFVLDI